MLLPTMQNLTEFSQLSKEQSTANFSEQLTWKENHKALFELHRQATVDFLLRTHQKVPCATYLFAISESDFNVN